MKVNVFFKVDMKKTFVLTRAFMLMMVFIGTISAKVVIEEILVNPIGDDRTQEYIVLLNLSETTTFNLKNWQLRASPGREGSGETWKISKSIKLEPGKSVKILWNTKDPGVSSKELNILYTGNSLTALNNEGGDLALLDPQNKMLHYVRWGINKQLMERQAVQNNLWKPSQAYLKAEEGISYVYEGKGNSAENWKVMSARVEIGELVKLSQGKSYFTIMEGLNHPNDLLFEANIEPTFFAYFDSLTIGIGSRFGLTAAVSPKVVLRMLRGKDDPSGSLPVRTPSYMPRGIIYILPESGSRFVKYSRYQYFSFMLSHHSNGQEGSFYTDSTSNNINYDNGNFSTNFLEFTYHLLTYKTNTFVSHGTFLRAYSIGLEWHPGFGMEKSLKSQRYADWRLNLAFHQISPIRFTSLQLSYNARLSLLLHRPEVQKTVNISDLPGRCAFHLRINGRSRNFANFGLFIDYYYGEDYYNIHFDRTLSVIRFGLTTDSAKLIESIF